MKELRRSVFVVFMVVLLLAAAEALHAGTLNLYNSDYVRAGGVDYGRGIAVDGEGHAYVTGSTRSTNFPIKNAFQGSHAGGDVSSYRDAFIAKFDPSGTALIYSTYLGGSGSDSGHGIAVDASGNAYVTGSTRSADFPTKNAFQDSYGGGDFWIGDAFITKLDPSGTALIYSTYLGGSDADDSDEIAVDNSGNAYVTGRTWSADFPTKNAFQGGYGGGVFWDGDAFIAKFDPSGTALIYSTYLGGSDGDSGSGIAVDNSGNAYVTGRTFSTDFPTQNPFQGQHGGGYWGVDIFVTKFSAFGIFSYSTYLGGSGEDYGDGIAVDASGNAYVTGETDSTNFPTAQAFQGSMAGGPYDAFVTRFESSGASLTYSTYLGGSGGESGRGIAVDASGNAYVTGDTGSSDFPTQGPLQDALSGTTDVFVTKFNASGSSLSYSTYLGGSGEEYGNAIAVDAWGNAYVTGETDSTNFPTKNAFQGRYSGELDAFVSKLDPGGTALIYSSYLGGSCVYCGDELAVDFGPNGLWLYDHSGPAWTGIGGPAEALENFHGDLAVDFGAAGLWLYDSSWSVIGGDPQAMESCGLALYADFGGAGLWRYDGAWSGIASDPDDLQCCNGELYVDFGASGLWRYNGVWRALAGDPTGMWCADGDLYANLSGGLWKYGWTWSAVGGPAQGVEGCGPNVYVDFGANGLWRYDRSWSPIGGDPQSMQCCSGDLYVDYGAKGLWRYDGAWSGLAGDPEDLCCTDDALYVDFAGGGLWRYDGSWTGLAGDTTVMTDVDINP